MQSYKFKTKTKNLVIHNHKTQIYMYKDDKNIKTKCNTNLVKSIGEIQL